MDISGIPLHIVAAELPLPLRLDLQRAPGALKGMLDDGTRPMNMFDN
jgi:hypothetical protein